MAKFADLQVGQVWAHTTARRVNYEVPWYANQVIIEDAETKYYKNHRDKFFPVTSGGFTGQYVKVTFVSRGVDYEGNEYERTRTGYVMAKDLFMHWDEYAVKLDRMKKQREKNEAELEARREYRKAFIQPKIEEIAKLMTELSGSYVWSQHLEPFNQVQHQAQVDLLLMLLREENEKRKALQETLVIE